MGREDGTKCAAAHCKARLDANINILVTSQEEILRRHPESPSQAFRHHPLHRVGTPSRTTGACQAARERCVFCTTEDALYFRTGCMIGHARREGAWRLDGRLLGYKDIHDPWFVRRGYERRWIEEGCRQNPEGWTALSVITYLNLGLGDILGLHLGVSTTIGTAMRDAG